MSKIYYGDRASGGSLKHYRTKGSRNGYSKNPKYRAVGDRAKGQIVNGRYVYGQSQKRPGTKGAVQWNGHSYTDINPVTQSIYSAPLRPTENIPNAGFGNQNVHQPAVGSSAAFTHQVYGVKPDQQTINQIHQDHPIAKPPRPNSGRPSGYRDAVNAGRAQNSAQQAMAAQQQAQTANRLASGQSRAAVYGTSNDAKVVETKKFKEGNPLKSKVKVSQYESAVPKRGAAAIVANAREKFVPKRDDLKNKIKNLISSIGTKKLGNVLGVSKKKKKEVRK